jgi:hypothetical protein
MPYSGLLGPAVTDDFTHRLGAARRHGVASADPGMVAQPPVDPGYAMPNADVGNLNQSPGQDVTGTLPAAYQQQLLQALQTLMGRT